MAHGPRRHRCAHTVYDCDEDVDVVVGEVVDVVEDVAGVEVAGVEVGADEELFLQT